MKLLLRTIAMSLSISVALVVGNEREQPPGAQAAGWVELVPAIRFCTSTTAAAQLSWISPRLSTEHWVDLSLQDNGFAEGSFLSAGPLGPGSNTYVWAGLQPGLVHYWRVVVFTPDGWIASETGAFESCVAPATSALPPQETSPDFAVTREMERDLFLRHNSIRADAGARSLELDDALTRVARERARVLAGQGDVSHFSPDNETAFSLLWKAGYVFIHGAENIGQNDYPMTRTVGAIMLGFLDSPPHRDTILDPRFTHVGVGMALTRDDWKYFVVVFAQR